MAITVRKVMAYVVSDGETAITVGSYDEIGAAVAQLMKNGSPADSTPVPPPVERSVAPSVGPKKRGRPKGSKNRARAGRKRGRRIRTVPVLSDAPVGQDPADPRDELQSGDDGIQPPAPKE